MSQFFTGFRQRDWPTYGRKAVLGAEAGLALLCAWAAVRFLPFRRAVRLGSRPVGPHADCQDEDALRRAIEAVANRVPWRAVCFQKGLAMQWLLRRRGCDARLCYGIGHGAAGALEAHVWVRVGERIVIGATEAAAFKCVAIYPADDCG